MRYLKYLADKDYALDRGMIPLGSCTMKLNAATEMAAVTWPEFAGLHPFAPESDVLGYLELIEQLQDWLAEVTGYEVGDFVHTLGDAHIYSNHFEQAETQLSRAPRALPTLTIKR